MYEPFSEIKTLIKKIKKIDLLKKENAAMKKKLDAVETEDKRTQFQVNLLEDKLDKVESMSKRKNLLFEGLPEVDDRREDVSKAICNLFDQLSVNKDMSFDACYRVGPLNQEPGRYWCPSNASSTGP